MGDESNSDNPGGSGRHMARDSNFPPFAVNAPMPKGTAVPPKSVKASQPTAQAPEAPPAAKKR